MPSSTRPSPLHARALIWVPLAAIILIVGIVASAAHTAEPRQIIEAESVDQPTVAHLAPGVNPFAGWQAMAEGQARARAHWYRAVREEAARQEQLRREAAARIAERRAAASVAPARPTFTGSIPDLIRKVFGPAGDAAIRVANCESSLKPWAVSPGGGNFGLFQINYVHADTWVTVTGHPWSERLDPYLNTVFAKWLYDRSGWGPWGCSWAA